jgi:hypothetical protein
MPGWVAASRFHWIQARRAESAMLLALFDRTLESDAPDAANLGRACMDRRASYNPVVGIDKGV